MRVRSEEKRQEIVRVAAVLFEEFGYERTSMDMISQKVGGSKATLYGYFRSKEDLLRAVLAYDVGEGLNKAMQAFQSDVDLRTGLVRLGIAHLENQLGPFAISNMRTVANQPAGSLLGMEFYSNVLRPAWEWIAREFAAMIEAGTLRPADPWTMAMHWKGLIQGDMVERRLLGAMPELDPEEIRRASTLAADAFITLYEKR